MPSDILKSFVRKTGRKTCRVHAGMIEPAQEGGSLNRGKYVTAHMTPREGAVGDDTNKILLAGVPAPAKTRMGQPASASPPTRTPAINL
jgi:hypothetical protein